MYYSARIPPGGMHTPLYPGGYRVTIVHAAIGFSKKRGVYPTPPGGGSF
jgi:hypothetical protein